MIEFARVSHLRSKCATSSLGSNSLIALSSWLLGSRSKYLIVPMSVKNLLVSISRIYITDVLTYERVLCWLGHKPTAKSLD